MSKLDPGRSLRDRFPALRNLEARLARQRLPFVQQVTTADCGAACLAMILRYHGKRVRLEDVREASGAGRDGASAFDLLNAARRFGLRGRGLRCDPQDLEYLPAPAILHWEFDHFVVLERLRKDTIEIVDPAVGRRVIPREQLDRSFTGVVLTLEPGEEFVPGRQGSNLLWRYLGRIFAHRPILTKVLVTSGIIQLFSLALPLLTAVLVDRVIPRRDHHLLTVLLIGFLAMTVFKVLTGMVRAHLLLHLRMNLDTRLTFDFVNHLIDLPYGFFQRRSAGDLMMRLNSNGTVREILTSSAFSGVLDGLMVGFYLLLLFLLSPRMGGLILLLAMFQVTVFLVSRRRYGDLKSQNLQAQANLQSFQVQMLTGIETLKAAGAEHRAFDRWGNLFIDELNVALIHGRLGIRVDAAMGLLAMGSPLLILAYGGSQVLDGSLSLGTMLAISAMAGAVLGPLSNLVSTAFRLTELGSYLERIEDVLETPREQRQQGIVPAGGLRGKITLESVSFRYEKSSPLVLRDVSVEIQPGQCVAIVGPSGSGKSTLAGLLVGFHRPTTGRVLYDDADLDTLDLRSVRRGVGYVPQTPCLFGVTLRENIALSDPSIPRERVVAAAQQAQIHQDILRMPLGYETPVSDGGASLSAGQRQRITIARALAQAPDILLLDESTSALDAVTERALMENLHALDCTRIIIAHRLSTIMQADLILVLEDGEMREYGTHETLVRAGGRYAKLVGAQMAGRASSAGTMPPAS